MDAFFGLFGLDFDAKNYSYFTVLAALANAYVPHVIAVTLAGRTYDNANPRGFSKAVTQSEAIDKITKNRIFRAQGAEANAYETLGFYAAAVVAANVARLPNRTLNTLTFAYVLSRLAYNFAYVALGGNRRLATVRSAVWGVGVGFAGALWYYAGQAALNGAK